METNYFTRTRAAGFLLLFFLLAANKGFCQYFKWANSIPGKGEDVVSEVTTDATGNVYSTGRFSGTVDFDPGPGTFNMTAQDPQYEPYILKLDANGNFLWAKQLKGAFLNYVVSIAITPSKKVCLAGYFQGKVDFDPGSAQLIDSTSFYNGYLLQLDTAGNFIDYKRLSAPSVYCQLDEAHHRANDIWISGSVVKLQNNNNVIDFDFGPGTYTLPTTSYYEYIARYDLNFNLKWVKVFDHNKAGFLQFINLVSDGDKNIYHSGFYTDTMDLDPSANVKLHGVVHNTFRGYVSGLDSVGNFLWSDEIFSTSDSYVMDVLTDNKNNLYVGGMFLNSGDLDPGPGTMTVNSHGSGDVFLLKLDQAGLFQSAVYFGGAGQDFMYQMAFSPDSNLVLAGRHRGADFDPGLQTFSIGANNADAYINVLDRNGSFVNALSFSNTAQGYSEAYCLDIYKDGSIYLGGVFSNTVDFNPGQNVYWQNHTQGQYDGFLVKLGRCNTLSGLTSQKICTGQTVTLMTSPVQSVTWTPGGSVSNQLVVQPVISSTYAAVGTPSTDCSSSLTFSVYVDLCSGLDELGVNAVVIYPNPNSGTFIVEGVSDELIRLFTSQGQLFREIPVSSSSQVEVSDLKAGVYFLVGKNWTKKIVVSR